MSDYFLILIVSGIAPLILSFYPPLNFYKNLKALIISLCGTLTIFGIWDIVAVKRGHWYFNSAKVWAVRILTLPLEEILFFIVIPFCCIFTWEALKYIRKRIK